MSGAPAVWRRLAWPAAALVAMTATGCGPADVAAKGPVPPAASPLSTSAVTGAGSWAVVVMGGTAADNNAFWQTFFRRAGAAQWTLVTPPGVASNGGLILAPGQGTSLLAGFRPGVDLTFSPLTATTDNGAHWTATGGVLATGLADDPDSLARTGNGNTIALARSGAVEQQAAGQDTWTALATARALAGTAAGHRCGLTALTAVSFTPRGTPLVAGDCSRNGVTGIFARAGGSWHPAAPPLPSDAAGRPVTVLRLTSILGGNAALLATTAGLIAAWSSGGGSGWTVSSLLPSRPTGILSAAFGSDGSISLVLPGGRAATIRPGAADWSQLPRLPGSTNTLAAGPANSVDALTVSGSTLTVWRLPGSAREWTRVQVIKVPVDYGSSG